VEHKITKTHEDTKGNPRPPKARVKASKVCEDNKSFLKFHRRTYFPIILNNYPMKAKRILWNYPRAEVEGIIPQYSLNLRRIIVLV